MPDQVVAGTPVEATDGFVGTVGHPVVDAHTNDLIGFILHKGMVAVVDVFLPADWIAEATPERIRLLVARSAVERLVDPRDIPTI